MKIRNKLLIGFLLVALIACIIGLVGYSGMNKVMSSQDLFAIQVVPSIEALGVINEAQSNIKAQEMGLMVGRFQGADRQHFYDKMDNIFTSITDARKIYDALPQFPQEAVIWKDYIAAWTEWVKAHEEFVALNKQKDVLNSQGIVSEFDDRLRTLNDQIVSQYVDKLRPTFEKSSGLLLKVITENEKGAANTDVEADVAATNSTVLLIIFIALGVVISIIIGIWISNNIQNIIKSLIAQAKMLADAAVAGKLATRGDPQKVNFEFREIVVGVNSTLDAVIGPLNVAAEYVDRISKGDIPAKITDNYNGDFNEIKNNLNSCIDAINELVADANLLAHAAVEGKLATRADASKHGGDFAKIVTGVNNTLDAVIGPLNVAAEYVDRISKGDIPAKITDNYHGDFNEIKNNLNTCIDAVNMLVADAGMLVAAAVEGKLYTRADAGNHQGDFGKIVSGVNETISTLVGFIDSMPAPAMIINKDFDILYMNKAGSVLNNTTGELLVKNKTKCYDHFKTSDCKTSKCACNKSMAEARDATSETDAHPGTYNLDIQYSAVPIKNKEGQVIGALEVVSDQTTIKHAARLAQKVADYQEIETKKVTENLTLLSVGDTNFKAVSGEADKDTLGAKQKFDTINLALSKCVDAVNSLVDDAEMLTIAAVDGRLDTRADARRHNGDFAKIVSGVNSTLDAVIGPLNVAADYVAKISVGDMPPVITDNYSGDFNKIKNNLNVLINALNEIVERARLVANGDLTVQLKKRSENDQLMESLTDMVKATANIITEFQTAASNISASSMQMSSTSQQMSQGATEQASSAEEVSSSMEEMAANIQQNTDNAQQTEKISLNAAEGINKVNNAAGETLKYMQEIADKVSIIGEIARQTNILALNAAVEAARAGEHGKGFAVVAAEVRKLAERSQISAVEIDQLTKNSVKATDESGRLLAAISPEIGKTAKLVQEIAAASIEQNSGADQVNNAIQQLNQVTQQNAAASEEMATSSEELASQAEQLLEMISFFKLDNNTRKVARTPQAAQKTEGRNGSRIGETLHSISREMQSTKKVSSVKGAIIQMGKDNLDSNYEKF
jgi:methyl-accepting chemotaxis protein